MLKNKTIRHRTTFLLITISSLILIPVVSTGLTAIIWVLLGIIVIGNLINLLIA